MKINITIHHIYSGLRIALASIMVCCLLYAGSTASQGNSHESMVLLALALVCMAGRDWLVMDQTRRKVREEEDRSMFNG